MFDRNKFSQRIKALRKRHNLTLEAFGAMLEISKQSAQKWEVGINMPSTENLIDIADYFDVSIDYLVGRSVDPKRY